MDATFVLCDARSNPDHIEKIRKMLESEHLCFNDIETYNGMLKACLDDSGNLIGSFGLEIYDGGARSQ